MICSHCGEDLPTDMFQWYWSNKRWAYYRRTICRECRRIQAKEYNTRRHVKVKRSDGSSKAVERHKIYTQLLAQQDGYCAICGIHQSDVERAFAIDHDHETGEIRGLLCDKCNRALGFLNDDPDTILNAYKYLNYFK